MSRAISMYVRTEIKEHKVMDDMSVILSTRFDPKLDDMSSSKTVL